MALIIPKERSWDCPEGIFSGMLVNLYEKFDNAGNTVEIRFIFQMSIPDYPNTIFVAGKTYKNPQHPDSEFMADMKRILGPEFVRSMIGKPFIAEEHYGRRIECKLTHKHNPGRHDRPFVEMGPLHRPGTLNLTKQTKPSSEEAA